MKSRQYYEALEDEELVDAAVFDAKAGRPSPDLMLVLAERLDERSFEAETLSFQNYRLQEDLDRLQDQVNELRDMVERLEAQQH